MAETSKHKINPAPNGATQWLLGGKRYTPGTEADLSEAQAATLKKAGAIGTPEPKPEPEAAPEPVQEEIAGIKKRK